MKVEIEQIITQIISFLIILWILSRYAWKPLLKLLDDRKEKIKSDWTDIDIERKKLDNVAADYQEKLKELDAQAKSTLAKIVEEGKIQAEAIQNDAHEQAKAILVQAQEDLKKEIAQARVQMKEELVDMTMQATEKLLQKNIDQDDQKKLAASYIDEMRIP